jgi:cholesterol oxidase
LHVLDGAAMPGPVGANPSLTIAAFSDRACDKILSEPVTHRVEVLGTPAVPATRATGGFVELRLPIPRTVDSCEPATSLAFTEEMKGYVALDLADPKTGQERACLGRR